MHVHLYDYFGDYMDKSISEAKKLLEEQDGKTIDRRAKRLAELEPIQTSSIEKEQAVRMNDYIHEAIKTYIEGCYKSCIFCCSCAVEQAFKKEMIFSKTSIMEREEMQQKLDSMTFGKLIGEAEKDFSLSNFIEDAKWLKDIRNNIAVHPIYISHGNIGTESREIEEWRKQSIKNDIDKLLPFFGDDYQKNMRKILNDSHEFDIIFEWNFSSLDDPFQNLALKAHKKMKNVVEGLYPSH